MIVTRHDNCAVCRKRLIVKREFLASVDMFDPDGSPLKGEISKQIKKWRDEPLYCKEHSDGKV